MDRAIAMTVLLGEATKIAGRSYAELRALIDNPIHVFALGPDAIQFQVEISAAWDDNPEQTLRLFFSIDDGGLRAYAPLTRGALVLPGQVFDGEFH